MGRRAKHQCSRCEAMPVTPMQAMLDAKCSAFDVAMRSDAFDVCAYRRLCMKGMPV